LSKKFAAKVGRSDHIKRKRWLLLVKCGENGRFGTKCPDFRDENRGAGEKTVGNRDEKKETE
jgi:hypothetical protein